MSSKNFCLDRSRDLFLDIQPTVHLRCGEECSGQAAHGKRAGNQGRHDSGVHSRIAWNSGIDLRGRDFGYLVTRSAEAPSQPAGGLRSAQERSVDGNKNDRGDARKLAELLRTNQVKSIYHEKHGTRALKELGRSI